VTSAGYAFISADYQLLPPATGHEIAKDMQDLLKFVVETTISLPSNPEMVDESGPIGFAFKIDPEAIAVAGSSAGGLCAYLAAMHCASPKPKAILSLYGQGGNFLVRTPNRRHFFGSLISSHLSRPRITSHQKPNHSFVDERFSIRTIF
jgi:alpha/beta hydrolase fold